MDEASRIAQLYGIKMTFVYPVVNGSWLLNLRKLYALLVILVVHSKLSHCWYGYPVYNESNYFTPGEQCRRQCVESEEPKICYFNFVIEFYTVNGPACDRVDTQDQCVWLDGVEKTVLTINRQIPGPPIEVCVGDIVVVDVRNAASGTEVTLHWHGLYQNGYQYYDGVPYVTQCPIPSSSSFRYEFEAQNPGTHFYHSHISTYILDGQYGPLIIRDAEDPHIGLYDNDTITLLMSDVIHELSLERFPGHYRFNLGQAAENIAINGRGKWTDPSTNRTTNVNLTSFTVTQGKRYRVRLINSFSTICPCEVSFESHNFTVIAQDGADVKPRVVDTILFLAGERVDGIIYADKDIGSYWIRARALSECADTKVQQFAILQYEGGPPKPSTPQPDYYDLPTGVIYNGLDATNCNTNNTESVVCVNQLESLEDKSDLLAVEPDARHLLPFWFFNYNQYGTNLLFEADTYPTFFVAPDRSQLISTFNNISFESPASSLISDRRSYQTICRPNELSTCNEPCSCTQVIHADLGSIQEFVLYDPQPLAGLDHPFHLHGGEFSLLTVGIFPRNRNITSKEVNDVIREHTERLRRGQYRNPPGKDTVKIPEGGYAIVRFRANNPGWWLLHCHFTWHHITGMELVIRVGEQYDLPPKPPGFPKCSNWKPPLNTLNDFYGFRYPSL